MEGANPRSAPQRRFDLPAGEPPGKNLLAVDQDHRHPLAVLAGKSRVVHIDHVEGRITGDLSDHGESVITQMAVPPGEERDHGRVAPFPMRPATVLALAILLAVILIAGIVLVIQLLTVG